MDATINILLLGRSGAGKSSLANYLYQKEIFKTGDGAPVTEFGKKDMDRVSIEKGDYTINIFDAPGLEPANYAKWKSEIGVFSERRSAFHASPSQWIHGAFYVINAASKRIEPAELDIIKNFPKEFYFPISVVFTNCDSASSEDIQDMKGYLEQKIPGIQIFQVCSVERKKRGGHIVQAFGREELLKGHADKVAFYFEQRMGIHFFDVVLPDTFHLYISRMKRKVKDSDLGFFTFLKDQDSLDQLIDVDQLEDELMKSQEIKVFEEFVGKLDEYVTALGATPHVLEEALDRMMSIDLDDEMERIAPFMKEISDSMESDSFLDKVGAVFKMGWFLMTLKGQLCDMLDNMESFAIDKCHANRDECREKLANPLAFYSYTCNAQG